MNLAETLAEISGRPCSLRRLMELCAAAGTPLTTTASAQAVAAVELSALTADSRQVQAGGLFAAFVGSKLDGSAFVAAAVAAGAAVVLTDPQTVIPKDVPPSVVVVRCDRPRRALALMAAEVYGPTPPVMAAVTGTNGKTSTAFFARELWQALGVAAGSLGTLGLMTAQREIGDTLTTPDPVALHRLLRLAAEDGTQALCMEASSQGLHQHRPDGVVFQAAAFTNLTRDHLDYHLTEDAYFAAKQRLFTEVLPAGHWAVLNADCPRFAMLAAACQAAGRRVMSFGRGACWPEAGDAGSPRPTLWLRQRTPTAHGQRLEIEIAGQAFTVELPLVGTFQADNALTALGLVLGCALRGKAWEEAPEGWDDLVAQAVAALETLGGVPGRLQAVGQRTFSAGQAGGNSGGVAPVFVDYAHTPDALEVALQALRPHVAAGGRLQVVFGCGGDRDPGKRPQMGAVAVRLADVVIVTDDNPRSEVPSRIRRQVMEGCHAAVSERPDVLVREINSRHAAIAAAVEGLAPGDVLLLAGKGHEQGQIIAGTVIPFDDREEARKALARVELSALWTVAEVAAAVKGCLGAGGGEQRPLHGVSIDSRTVASGDLFIALVGPSFDGHDWVADALNKGAACAVVHRSLEQMLALCPSVDPSRLLVVDDTFGALNDLGRAGRQRCRARVVGVTGSVGKTSTKEMLALVLSALGKTHAAVGSFNNHWGVPLTLARLPADADFAVIEMGMNHAGEIAVLTQLARPHVAVVTTVAPAHIEHLGSLAAIADAKAEIFAGVVADGERAGVAILPLEAPHADRLVAAAQAAGLSVCGFTRGPGGAVEQTARLLSVTLAQDETVVEAVIQGQTLRYAIGSVGEHWAMNSLAVLAAVRALCADSPAVAAETAARVLRRMTPPKGRGQRHRLSAGRLLIDESYNANPASMEAAFAALAAVPLATEGGRRVVVLGDMRELGDDSEKMHVGLATAITANRLDRVYCCGAMMKALFAAVPADRRGQWAADSEALAPLVCQELRAGDVVMVKGSAGSRMGVVVAALLAELAP